MIGICQGWMQASSASREQGGRVATVTEPGNERLCESSLRVNESREQTSMCAHRVARVCPGDRRGRFSLDQARRARNRQDGRIRNAPNPYAECFLA